jgi:replicative DNA helicase Mcm
MVNVSNLMLEDLQENTQNPNMQRIRAMIQKDLTSSKNIQIFTPGNEIRTVGIIETVPTYVNGQMSVNLGYGFQIMYAELFEPEITIDNFSAEDKEKIKELAKKIDKTGFEEICPSFAPEVYGYEPIKNSLMLQACCKKNNIGKKIRNKPNILLIGDPGIAKSVLANFAASTTPGSRKVVGGGSSAVGITASVIKEDENLGGYRVEPGALVLAKELLVLDEMNNLQDEDKPKLQEGMSEQCYDDKTEILTENGWKLFKDLNKEEKVATLSKEGKLEFYKPEKHVVYDYEGNMVEFKSRQCDLLVTQKHRMYVSRKLVKKRKGYDEFRFIHADELKNKCFRIKRDAKWEGKDEAYFIVPSIKKFGNQNCKGFLTKPIKFKMDDWLEFLGYYFSEGSLNYQNNVPYNVFISQSKEANKEICEKISKCLNNLNLKWKYDGKNFYFCNKQIATYLSNFGKGAREKFIPNFIKELVSRQIKIFIEAMLDGDGYRGKTNITYVTSSKRLADGMQELLLRIELSGNIYRRSEEKLKEYEPSIKGRKLSVGGDIYEVSIVRNNTPFLNHHKKWYHVKDVYYKGNVYCVEVKDNIIFVRRNGKPCWSGNTVTVNKANLHVKLKVTAGVLATANPKNGNFDSSSNYVYQFNIPTPIINRFDLIFVMRDDVDAERDKAIARSMLNRERGKIIPKYDVEFLKKFFVYVRNSPDAVLTDKISEKLEKLYHSARKNRSQELVINPRFMETLIRLVKASAKIRLSKEVQDKDIKRAPEILNKTHFQVSEYHNIFEDDVQEEALEDGVQGSVGEAEKAISEEYDAEEWEKFNEAKEERERSRERSAREDYE